MLRPARCTAATKLLTPYRATRSTPPPVGTLIAFEECGIRRTTTRRRRHVQTEKPGAALRSGGGHYARVGLRPSGKPSLPSQQTPLLVRGAMPGGEDDRRWPERRPILRSLQESARESSVPDVRRPRDF